ncbi:uncharacterized protein LOC105797491 [Gossypium raimondii]|uniref:uncharacterized protein LOC105797491 n=1 Tax=Gossypium raimondii TaxID=29730 RepID=UPI00063A971A|nr:uncharacterized protein LOC105797491 [Gossypium raimondii]
MQALGNNTTQPIGIVHQPPRGRGQARGCNGLGRGQRILARGVGHTKVRQPPLVYAARRREDGDAPNVITGTFFIYNVSYTALINIGSTHSYIAYTVSKKLGILVDSTTSDVIVLSPLGQSIRVNILFRDVSLEGPGAIFLTDLMELPFGEFDLILGTNWLVKHRVSLDCATKRVVLRTSEDSEVVVIEEHRNYLSNVISALRAKKLVRKICEAYLAYINVSDSGDSLVKDIRIVKEFLDIFLEELPGLPLNLEVEFRIELLPGTTLVSIAPYRMSLKELGELKAQIQVLLDRGFILPSVSPWGAPILVDPRKIEAVLDWKQPKTGMPFNWTDAQQESFEKLKTVLTKALILIQPESRKEFTVYSDSSHIKGKQIEDESLGLRCRQVEIVNIEDFGLNSEGVLYFRRRICVSKDTELSWEDYLPLAEFAYNNSYQSSIQMAPYEALYGHRCRTPSRWTELGELHVLGPELVSDTEDKRVGPVAYNLELPLELDQIYDVFHVSMLRHYRSDPTHIVPIEEIEARPDLTFEEEPVQVLERDVKVLRRNSIPLVKVLWRNHSSEDAMRQQYPHLF